ncbi:MAG: solute carrier family 26 protein [Sphingomonadales bacterium]
MMLNHLLPRFDWARGYDGAALGDDLVAALIVTIMLIPQSLAYALLAGLPPEAGLYASILPLLGYALFGSSRALAVGPVAVVSLMTAAAVGQVAAAGSAGYLAAALALALLSGSFLWLMGAFKLGFLANFLSHPVISGFMTASGLIISASQLKHVMGIDAGGHDLLTLLTSLAGNAADSNAPTLVIGVVSLVFLWAARGGLARALKRLGMAGQYAQLIARAAPVAAVAATTWAAWAWGLDARGVAIVGDIPQGLPPFALPAFDAELWRLLLVPAILISIVGFVESVSVAQTLAAKRRQRIDPDRELLGLGTANVAAAFSGGFPVTGGLARSVVNFDAGARTPLAGVFTAGGILLATLFLTPWLYYLPKATLAATIIVAVLSLVDLGALRRTWAYSKSDFAAMAATIAVTLGFGVEPGILAGVALSLALHLYRSSRPHCAIVGQVPGTEHFRNIDRHHVVTSPYVASLRVDESLYFANARFLEDRINRLIADQPEIRHVVLMCPAVNEIDASALESLEAINHQLQDAGIVFHLSEVKGPVMDRLKRSHFLDDLTGEVFLSQFDALRSLDPETAQRALAMPKGDSAK